MLVWLWDAGRARGVTDNEVRARKAAEAFMRNNRAIDEARMEMAVVNGPHALNPGYARTGRGWQAVRGPRGGVRWVPLPGQH